MPQQAVIDRATTINAVVELHPGLMPILSAHGLDLCCGGPLTLQEAAERHGLDLAALVAELEEAAAVGAAPASAAGIAPTVVAARS